MSKPIISASGRGDIERVHIMLTNVDVNASVDDNEAIILASKNGHSEVVKLLLSDSRVDPSARDNIALHYASKNGHVKVVKVLLEDPRVDPSSRDNEAIIIASENGHSEVVKLLLSDPRVDPSARNNEAFDYASSKDHVQVVKLLLSDPRVNPSSGNNFAIRIASRNGYDEVVKMLLADHRVDPTMDGNESIRIASRNGHGKVVKLLLADPRVDPSTRINQAIMFASRNGHDEVVKLLLDDPRVLNSLTKNQYVLIKRKFPGININRPDLELNLKNIIKTKLLPGLQKYRYKSEMICKVFKALENRELEEVADIYNLDKNLSRKELCFQLGEILKSYINNKNKTVKKCSNEQTIISLEDVQDIPPRNFFSFQQNGKVFCDDILDLGKHIETKNTNPYTNVPLSSVTLGRLKTQYSKIKKDYIEEYYDREAGESYYSILSDLLGYIHYPRSDEFFRAFTKDQVISFVKKIKEIEPTIEATVEKQRISSMKDLIKYLKEYPNLDIETKKIIVTQLWNGHD